MAVAAEDAKHRRWWRIVELQPIRRKHGGNKLPLQNGWRQEPGWRDNTIFDRAIYRNLLKGFFLCLRIYVCMILWQYITTELWLLVDTTRLLCMRAITRGGQAKTRRPCQEARHLPSLYSQVAWLLGASLVQSVLL